MNASGPPSIRLGGAGPRRCAATGGREWAVYEEPRSILGEAPLWNGDEGRLYWVDCHSKLMFRLDPGSHAIENFPLGHHPGSYAFRDGGMIMAFRSRLALTGRDGGGTEPVATPEVDFAAERFNDGICDRRGRFWVGTMERRLREPVASLFRVDPDLSVHRMFGGLTVSNGIAFSPDYATLYLTNSGTWQVYAFDYDENKGTIGNRRVFVDFTGGQGRPDGCVIDSEGHLWVAELGAGRLGRFDPSGRRVSTLDLPTSRPTSLAFGGGDLATLYVTTMRFDLTEEELARDSLAGCLFATPASVPGLARPRFAG